MIKVTTMEGAEMLINPAHVVIMGPVQADGQPLLGMSKLLFVNGAAVVIRMTMEEFNEASSNRPSVFGA